MKKKIAREMAEMCNNLPVVMTEVKVKKIIMGSDLLKQGVKECEGQPVRKNIRYEYLQTVKKPVNHFSICKNIFKSHGISAVIEYCSQYLDKGQKAVISEQIAKLKEQQQEFTNEIQIFEDGQQKVD